MSEVFSDVQRIVLVSRRWQAARHLMLDFGEDSYGRAPLHFLNRLLQARQLTTAEKPGAKPDVQFSLGFTRLGLKRVDVPAHVLACFALKSPAYSAGAARRAAGHLGLTGDSSPEFWDDRFTNTKLHAVLSIHARDKGELEKHVAALKTLLEDCKLAYSSLEAAALDPPTGQSGQWVHFGYRDGLTRISIEGWGDQDPPAKGYRPISPYKAGEFVLGQLPEQGADPWVAGPGLRVWPDKTRAFFRNGSFGVLQRIEQRVSAFEAYVRAVASSGDISVDEVKGLLCGRTPGGRPLADDKASPEADFNYEKDPNGFKCPFGSHVRRMNPRVPASGLQSNPPSEATLAAYPAHFSRPRPLLRRGMPYGEAWKNGDPDDGSRGLIGQFFCASIENQYEHLLGQWGDRVPLGSPDQGGARDPFIGGHAPDDGPFKFRDKDGLTRQLEDMTPFTRTRGVAYLFYPSLTTLSEMADSSLWGLDDEDNEA